MNRSEAMALLGLVTPEDVSIRSIRAAWARKVRVSHPDTAEDVRAEAAANIKKYGVARDLLLAVIADQNRTCALCKGSGKVRGRVGAVDCHGCSGTGEKFRG